MGTSGGRCSPQRGSPRTCQVALGRARSRTPRDREARRRAMRGGRPATYQAGATASGCSTPPAPARRSLGRRRPGLGPAGTIGTPEVGDRVSRPCRCVLGRQWDPALGRRPTSHAAITVGRGAPRAHVRSTPLFPARELDGGEVITTHQRGDLGAAGRKFLGYLVEGEEAGLGHAWQVSGCCSRPVASLTHPSAAGCWGGPTPRRPSPRARGARLHGAQRDGHRTTSSRAVRLP